ncbi:MAG: hypothetical protein ACRDPW_09250 [Mycobacteriales bacterium]
MTAGPTAEEFRNVIQSALSATTDAGTAAPQERTLFTPDKHRSALEPDVTVVRGARGVGKTLWFKALRDDTLRALTAEEYQIGQLHTADSLVGYGEELRPDVYPGPASLANLVANGVAPYDIWTAVLLLALKVPQVLEQDTWEARVDWVRRQPEKYEQALFLADQRAGDSGRIKLFLFDALDRLHRSRRQASQLIEGILRLALELRTRTSNLRAKVFIRPDMFNSGVLRFPDASKLTASVADLTWSETNLYGLLFHRLGNAEDAPGALAFRRVTGEWQPTESGRYLPPGDLIGNSLAQKRVFTTIAGEWMGKNHRKGHTYTWLPNHLMDGIGQVSPRSFLQAVITANEFTKDTAAGHTYALHWEGIRQGVQAASQTRVDEIVEDLPWVKQVMTPLAGLQVPTDQEAVIDRWKAENLAQTLRDQVSSAALGSDEFEENAVRTGPRDPSDGSALVEELIEIGVMSRRSTGKLDLPDVYRIAFDLGRKGGVPRAPR